MGMEDGPPFLGEGAKYFVLDGAEGVLQEIAPLIGVDVVIDQRKRNAEPFRIRT